MNESDTWIPSSENGSYEQKKPSHVRRLNFGQSILTLHVVKQFQGQKDGALTLNRDVTMIPCTSKGEFVRKWIETHGDLTRSDSDESISTSPILGLRANKRAVQSPISCERRKRARRKNESREKKPTGIEQQLRPIEKSVSRLSCNERKENVRRNLFRSESTADRFVEPSGAVSPVLGGRQCFHGIKKKRLDGERSERKPLHRIENENRENLCNANTSPIICGNSSYYQLKRRRPKETNIPNQQSAHDVPRDVFCSQKRRALASKLAASLREDASKLAYQHFADNNPKNTKISEDSTESDLSVSEKRLNIEESPEEAPNAEGIDIEIESVHEADDGGSEEVGIVEREDITEPSGDENHSSIRIEDEDTQEPNSVPIIRVDEASSARSFPATSGSAYSYVSQKDSDQTFFSKAERPRCVSTVVHPSQQISQISSQVNTVGNNESTRTGIIISGGGSSPQQMYSDLPMHIELLESTKKRRKPKKGSLSEKLRSIINRQGSFLRIWKHHFKQTIKDNVTVPCVTVHAQKCVFNFGRQFLEGIATEDPFNLLPSLDATCFPRLVNVMTIPEIVGKIDLRFPSVVRIFPPWDILDDKELTLNVTYIKVENNNRTMIREENETGETRVERSTVKEFDCLCIRSGIMNPSCNDRLNKPDVIAKLFDVDE